MNKKTFDEWIAGFEERYTSEQLNMFRDVWETSIKIREVNEAYHSKETAWLMFWIHEVATEIGR